MPTFSPFQNVKIEISQYEVDLLLKAGVDPNKPVYDHLNDVAYCIVGYNVMAGKTPILIRHRRLNSRANAAWIKERQKVQE